MNGPIVEDNDASPLESTTAIDGRDTSLEISN